MDREASWRVIEQQRLAVAEMLADLTPQQWDSPSLCAGWRIREVAAHLAVVPNQPSIGTMVSTGLRSRGDYNRFINDLTVRYAEQPTDVLVRRLREDAGSRRHPKLTNYRNLLFDTMVHAQDMAIPLHREISIPVDAAVAATERAVTIGWPVWDRHRLDGIRLSATDIDWAHGAGGEVRGPITALLLLATGRPVALDQVSGDGVDLLRSRLS